MANKRACRNCRFSEQTYYPCEALPKCGHPEEPKGKVRKDHFCLKWRERDEEETAPRDEFDNPYDG